MINKLKRKREEIIKEIQELKEEIEYLETRLEIIEELIDEEELEKSNSIECSNISK